ncbi:excitatory amino acid transporter 1-like [Culicoides brevitarsis]|uniref:excitatory amino acid transporter 1-like n=1 Tax=Culicoides brevitarsis TaxID=469753 RepID=UPI00307C80C4
MKLMKVKKLKLSPVWRENLLTILTVSGVILGIVLGLIVRFTTDKWTEREISYIYFIGDIFLRMLKALILPLIVSSLISAVGNLDLSLSGKIGSRAVGYYLLTTVMAVVLGIILVTTIQPGNRIGETDIETANSKGRNITITDTLLDLVRNMFPPNVVQACIQQYQTLLKPPSENPAESDLAKWDIKHEYIDQMNILGLVICAIVFGIALSSTKNETKSVLNFVVEFSHVIMKITGWVIWLSPIGIIFLIMSKMLEMEDLGTLFGSLGLYTITVAGGILFHGFVVLPLIFFVLTRENPYVFISKMGKALATAFGTSSSSATLPVTMQCLEENAKVDPRVSRFVIPIGATINMDGTALYEAVAAIFIAQLRGRALSFGNIIAISITATAASIGAAGIPQAGLVTLVMVLDTIGLPAADVSLIVAVDWLLDRFRTLVNVLGDSYGAKIIEHYSKSELKRHSMEQLPTANGNTDTKVAVPEVQMHIDDTRM